VTGPALSIIVVAYRQREALLECLGSCSAAAAEVAGGTELIVVDNDSLAPLVREHFAQTRLIEPGVNLGFAEAVQRAIGEAHGRWIALVNDDARIEPDALAALITAGERSPRIGAVAAQVRFAGAPDRINSAGIAVDSLGIATERLAGAPATEAAEPTDVFGPSACFALYRTEMLAQVGGFDGRFFAYLEDVDLAWRSQAAGWSCVYEPHAIAYHHGSYTSGHGSAMKYFLVGRNRIWLLARNATRRQLLRALPGIVLYDSAYVLYVALTDRTLAPLRGRIAGLVSWREWRQASGGQRREVGLSRGGWRAALGQHRAYHDLARAE
jgi:GT2 family glycosyltransferase